MKLYAKEKVAMLPQVVFSDNHLLVVKKPAGMSTQPHKDNEDSLEHWAKAWVKRRYSKPGNVFLVPVHRLDKPAKGLVLFARSSKALSRLNEMMRARKIVKVYHAYIQGDPPAAEGILEDYLLHDDFHARIVDKNHPSAKKAVLHYRFIESLKGKKLLEITLHTGRYHQIRAQLAGIGCPIIGDIKYDGLTSQNSTAIELYHVRLEFLHPVSKEPLVFFIDSRSV
jgi:23S rRNA pseudouridine1911/1915/1917 synthase